MITILTSTPDLHWHYLSKRGKSISHRMGLNSYRDLAELHSIPARVAIFAAIDRLSPLQREVAAEIWTQLTEAGQCVLNHPAQSWRRYQLLHNLYEMGRNVFQVFRADELSKVARFPVFVREADLHTGSLTPLLGSRSALQHALRELTARGYHAKSLLIVEFCDTKDSTGLIRKYSAFKVGEHVLAKNLMISAHWMVKDDFTLSDEEVGQELVQEQQEYIRNNPHEAWIREIFELAEIRYGRIDYGFSNGEPQVWEVNTDPTIQARPSKPRRPGRELYRAMRKRGQDLFHERFRAALCELDGTENGATEIPVHLGARPRMMLRAERGREIARRTIHSFVENLICAPPIQRLKPWLKPLATDIAPRLSQIIRSRPR